MIYIWNQQMYSSESRNDSPDQDHFKVKPG